AVVQDRLHVLLLVLGETEHLAQHVQPVYARRPRGRQIVAHAAIPGTAAFALRSGHAGEQNDAEEKSHRDYRPSPRPRPIPIPWPRPADSNIPAISSNPCSALDC